MGNWKPKRKAFFSISSEHNPFCQLYSASQCQNKTMAILAVHYSSWYWLQVYRAGDRVDRAEGETWCQSAPAAFHLMVIQDSVARTFVF